MAEPEGAAQADGGDSGKGKDGRRYEKQMRESRKVLRESSNILKNVTAILDKAAEELGEFGESPFEDLERRQ